ncbi:integrase catalytic domain-containing protein [Trichonephila clavipes]|nr:integrase catalytic domain-containing protein [Trichonephila clavipes]
MHVFVDACKEAYTTCIFFRSNTPQGVKVALVRAKARVAPLKQVTIPRLELMACYIGARWAHSVQESLNITEMETVFWSDSMVALYWLREKGGWSVFVSNRIKEIKNLFPKTEWRHVRKKINPADLISRGCSPSHLVESNWWEGPMWLVESPDIWPITKLPDYDTSEISLERKKVRLCNLNLSEKILPLYARKFSKFHSILRLVALVLRFLNNVRNRISDRKKGQLSLDELESAEIELIRSVQAQSFTDEKLVSNLSVFRDDNIIRVKTRITERIGAPNFLSPILLPKNCVVTQRLLEHFNLKNHHAGTQLPLSIIREKYWIIGGRRTVRKI